MELWAIEGDDLGAMEWSGKLVAAMLAAWLVIGLPVVLGVLRLSGIISWPPLWAVFALFGVLLVAFALVLVWASHEPGRGKLFDFWDFFSGGW